MAALNVVDLASTYQQVICLDGTKSEDAAKAFTTGWLGWAGTPKPKHVTADLDSAFKDRFLAEMDARGIAVRCAAGHAHWQNGVAERRGAAWKAIYDKVVIDRETLLEEVQDTVAIVNEAKNSLRNRSGFSPRQWVFGANGIRDDDDGTQDFDLATPNAKFARLSALRNTAKAAFFETQAVSAVRKAMAHKPRVEGATFEPGTLVYYFRLLRPGRGKKPQPTWAGPATVIGREGANYWLARGGRCVLVASEHLRCADHGEVSELLRNEVGRRPCRRSSACYARTGSQRTRWMIVRRRGVAAPRTTSPWRPRPSSMVAYTYKGRRRASGACNGARGAA